MSARFQEIDRQSTPMGEISIRRRLEPTLLVDVFEVKLGDEHLMSSLFTAAEVALADLALAELPHTGLDQIAHDEIGFAEPELDVVVGGLGLGFTARAALGDPRVRTLDVVEALDAVIDWHERELLPNSTELMNDTRCHLVHGDFFAVVADRGAFGPDALDRYHAILLDIDHTPTHVLHPSHAAFYTSDGLTRLADRIHPGGAFALWSDRPDDDFLATARQVFATCDAHEVRFPNHHTGEEASNTVYVARTSAP